MQQSQSNNNRQTNNNLINKSKSKLPVAGFFRGIFAWWVVLCHTMSAQKLLAIVKCFLPTKRGDDQNPNQHQGCGPHKGELWEYVLELRYSPWVAAVMGLGFQVDIFFGLAGFLFTWQTLLQEDEELIRKEKERRYTPNTDDDKDDGDLQLDVIEDGKQWAWEVTTIVSWMKRIFRLWMATFIQLFLTMTTGEFQVFANGYIGGGLHLLWRAMTFSSGEMPPSLNSAWSSRVDFIAIFVVMLIAIMLRYYFPYDHLMDQQDGYTKSMKQRCHWSMITIVLSLIPKVFIFCIHVPRLSYLALGSNPNLLSSMLPLFVSQYSMDVMHQAYPDTFSYPIMVPQDAAKEHLRIYDYTVYYQRWTPFFIGMYFAYWFHHQSHSSMDNQEQPDRQRRNWWEWLRLCVAILISFLPLWLPFLTAGSSTTSSAMMQNRDTPKHPFVGDLIISVFLRPLYTLAVLYLIICCELPSWHGQSIPFVDKMANVLSWLQESGRLSFMIYACHPKVLNETVLSYIPINTLVDAFGWNARSHFLIWSFVVVIGTVMVAWIAHDKVELPLNKWVKRYIPYFKATVLSLIRTVNSWIRNLTNFADGARSPSIRRTHSCHVLETQITRLSPF